MRESRNAGLEQRRLQSLRALEAARARYENLYQDAPDMFASVTVDTERVVQCNATLLRATGFRRQEVLGRPLVELHDVECASDLSRALDRVRADGRARDVELRLRRRDDSFLDVSLSMTLVRDERQNYYYRSIWRDVTDRKRAEDALRRKQAELERSQAELQALAGRLLTAQDDERRRISRELHDDVNQRLAMLTLDVESLQADAPLAPGATTERLTVIRNRLVELSDDVHGLAYGLHPSVLDHLGLKAALRSHVSDLQRHEAIRIALRIGEIGEPLPPGVAACLYRVAQAALRNVVKHARASRATVEVEADGGGVRLSVSDDGRGFAVPERSAEGLGILGMQERVRLVGGRFALTSTPGDGSRVTVWVPLPGGGAGEGGGEGDGEATTGPAGG
jgi:PAS domain S-box-containing protein